ncbi:MAG TPA: hypothetical protein VNS62_02430, partial [Candidatus Udaeobacter sp.]|nr:hypothetical protein [Candidatus Udaeobacter sp.]
LHPENYWQHQERPMQGGARAGRGWKKIESSNAAGSKIAIRPLFAGVALEMTAQRGLPFGVDVSTCLISSGKSCSTSMSGTMRLACIERPDGV